MRARVLARDELERFAKFTYPVFRPSLLDQSDDSVIAVGGEIGGIALGLAFAVCDPNEYEILSVYISLDDPNGLLRAMLIDCLMQHARARHWPGNGIFNPSYNADDKGLVRALDRCGWTGPTLRSIAAWTSIDRIDALPIVALGAPRPGYTIVPWRDIGPDMRSEIVTASAALPDNVRRDLDPLRYEACADMDLSLLLLRDGRPIGWHLPERLPEDRYRWTCSAVAPGHWAMAPAMILWKAALDAQRETGVNGVIWGVPVVHTNMVRFVLRRLRPALVRLIIGGSFTISPLD